MDTSYCYNASVMSVGQQYLSLLMDTHLHRDDVGPRGVGHCHPVWQVHAAVAVGPEEGVRVGYGERPGVLSPLGGVLWRLHKGNWEVRG